MRPKGIRGALAALAIGALALGGFSVAQAGCAFTVRADAATLKARTDALITVECLHDAAGNPLAGKSVTVDITRPNGASSSHVVTTDEAGGATFVYTNTHGIGSYSLSAVSGLATASGTFAVATDPASGAFQLLPSNGCVLQSAPAVTLNAFGIRDPAGDPAAPSDVVFTIKPPSGGAVADLLTPPKTFAPRTATSVRPSPASDADFTTASVGFDFTLPDSSVHAPAGTWTVTAATQSASAATTFQVVAAVPAGTPATVDLTAPTARVVPGLPATLAATVKDSAGAAIPCAAVDFTVTPPGGGPAVVTTVQTNATGVATLPHNRTDAYGEYNVLATAGSASKTAKFSAAAGDIGFSSSIPSYIARAEPTRQVTGNAVTVMAANVVDTTRRPIGGGAAQTINLWTSKPDGESRFEDAVTVAGATHRTGRADASKIIAAADVDQDGDWLLQAFVGDSVTGDPALDWNVDLLGLFLVTFQSTQFQVVASLPAESPGSPVRDVGVAADDATAMGGAVTVEIGSLPAGTDLVEITVTMPDDTTYTRSTSSITGDAASIALGGVSETGLEGLYEVSATSSQGGTTNGTGAGSFLVSVPRTLTVGASPAALALPAEATTLTATLVETLTAAPVEGAGVTISVENALGLVVKSVADETDADGQVSTTAGALDTLLPGTYKVTATSEFGHISTTYFVVVIALPPAPPSVP